MDQQQEAQGQSAPEAPENHDVTAPANALENNDAPVHAEGHGAEGTHTEVGTAHEAGAHHDEAFYQDPAFWVGLAFVTIVVIVIRPVLRMINGSLDARAALIRSQIEEAKKLREDAQALLAEYQKKQRDAMAEAEQIIAQAKTDAARLKAEAEQDLVNSVERRKQQALERIAQSEAQAVAEVRNTAIDVALAAAEQLIQQNLGKAQQDALADKDIAELAKRLN
jgi:F-type H+-transporting ATPase subunit b